MPPTGPLYNTTSNPWIYGTASSQPDRDFWSKHQLAAMGMGVTALGFTAAMLYAGIKNGPRLCGKAYNYCLGGGPPAGDFPLGPIDVANVLPEYRLDIPNQNYVQPF
jgi:hypothetical protein